MLVIIYFNRPDEVVLNAKYSFQKQIETLLGKPAKTLNRPVITFTTTMMWKKMQIVNSSTYLSSGINKWTTQ